MFISSSWVLELVVLPVFEGHYVKPSHVILAASEDCRWEPTIIFFTEVEAHYGIIVTFEVSRGYIIAESALFIALEVPLKMDS